VTLRDLLTPDDLARVRARFSWDVGGIDIVYGPIDGTLNVMGTTIGNLLSPMRVILLDSADVPLLDRRLDLRDPLALETVFHELCHADQARTLWGRLKSWWWRKTLPYEQRPHEIEAREKAHSWANQPQ
jgi:hypothetical protein